MKIRQITPECPEHGAIAEVVEPDGSRRLTSARPVKDGEDLRGLHLVEIDREAGEDSDGYFRASTVYDGRSGPAQVASPKYRDGWDRIFDRETN